MHSDSPDDGIKPDLVAEMRAVVEETQRAIEASQAILDRCAELSGEGSARAPEPRGGASDALDAVADGLIHACRFAKLDGDPLTVALIEKALFHVGRRLARGMTPAEAGLVCH